MSPSASATGDLLLAAQRWSSLEIGLGTAGWGGMGGMAPGGTKKLTSNNKRCSSSRRQYYLLPSNKY